MALPPLILTLMQTVDHLRRFGQPFDIERVHQLLLIADTPAHFEQVRQLIAQVHAVGAKRFEETRRALDASLDKLETGYMQNKKKRARPDAVIDLTDEENDIAVPNTKRPKVNEVADTNNDAPLKFMYNNCLQRHYNSTRKNVKQVTFAISRYYDVEHTIAFPKPTTEAQAIQAVELYLSQPITEDYFNQIKDNTVLGDDKNKSWAEIQKKYAYQTRGDALGCAIELEGTKIKDGHLTFTCGS